jgi:hypothetical protein
MVVGLQPSEKKVNLTTGVVEKFGIRVLDKFMNPVRNAKVVVEVSGGIGKIRGSDRVEMHSDSRGEVWIFLNTTRDISGNCISGSVKFNASGVETAYDIMLCKPSVDFALEFPLAVIYNARTDSALLAFGDEVNSLPPTNYDVPASRQLNDSKISKEDGIYEYSQANTNWYYAAHRFEFHIDTNREVSEFCINWKGYGWGYAGIIKSDDLSMYIWNFTSNSYDSIAEYVSSDSGIWLGKCYYDSEVGNYISNGKIIVLVGTSYPTRSFGLWGTYYSKLNTDYVQLLVVYE